MKKTATILAGFITGIVNAQQAPIVNGFDGFENWNTAQVGLLPQGWDGFNRNVQFNGATVGTVECVKRSGNDPFEGNYSAKLTSTSIMGGPSVPGILTTGTFVVNWNTQDGEITGGEAYTDLPTQLNGQFKFAPQGVDTAFVSVWFLQNGQEVGRGRLEFTDAQSAWTAFSVAIDYDLGAAPDSMNMVISSSNQQSFVPEGTVLEIDALSFDMYVELEERERASIQCFPNPTADAITVDFGDETFSGQLELINQRGESVRQYYVEGKEVQLDVHDLPAGKYYLLGSDQLCAAAFIKR